MEDINQNAVILDEWLRKKPVSFAQAISSRIALRVLPFINVGYFTPEFAQSVFRAVFIAWAAHRYSANQINAAATSAWKAADAACNAFAIEATDRSRENLHVITSDEIPEAASAGFAAFAVNALNINNFESVKYALMAADAASLRGYESKDDIWAATEEDVRWLETLSINRQAPEIPASLVQLFVLRPTWWALQPFHILNRWNELKSKLAAQKQDWDIWIDWYERRLQGDTNAFGLLPVSEESVTLSIAMESDAFWDRDPALVNAEIKARLLAAVTELKPPKQDSSTLTFVLDEHGLIQRGPLPDENCLSDTSKHQDQYDEFLKSFSQLTACSGNALGETLKTQCDDLNTVLPQEVRAVNPHLFWPRFDRLRRTYSRHIRALNSTDYSPYRLESETADTLQEVVQNGNIFVFNQPILIDKEDQAKGTQNPPIDTIQLANVRDIIRLSIEDPEVTSPDVRRDIEIALEATDTTNEIDDVARKQAVKTQRNFLIIVFEKFRLGISWSSKKIGEIAFVESTKSLGKHILDNREAIMLFFNSLF